MRHRSLIFLFGYSLLLLRHIPAFHLIVPPHDQAKHNSNNRSHTLFSRKKAADDTLIPQENPHADPNQRSLAGRVHGQVLQSLNILYPPHKLEDRNALSRSDGYWRYIEKGRSQSGDPPLELTYGEFDFFFFARLLDETARANGSKNWSDCVFVDLGSGAGRLVFGAASLYPNFRLCRGIEILPRLHQEALDNVEECIGNELSEDKQETAVSPLQAALDRFVSETELALLDEESRSTEEENSIVTPRKVQMPRDGNASGDEALWTAPMDFQCSSFADPYVFFGDADIVFCFSSCMPEYMLQQLGQAIGRQCKPGTIVITIDKELPLAGTCKPIEKDDRIPGGPFEFTLLNQIDGYGWVTGGQTTAYIYRVTKSLWREGVGPLSPRELSLEEVALDVVRKYEEGKLTDSNAFLRAVYNNMVFSGLPDSFLPQIDTESEHHDEH